MFEPHVVWFGAIPPMVVLVVVAGLLWLIGWLWWRRIVDPEPETHSFLANPGTRRNVPLTLGLVLAAIAVGLVWFVR